LIFLELLHGYGGYAAIRLMLRGYFAKRRNTPRKI
jgi:hypothetical protein